MERKHRITVEVNDVVYNLLRVLASSLPDARVEDVVGLLIDHAQQGVYRPGAWEREWICSVFPYSEWANALEAGDPYGRAGCDHIFNRPRRLAR